MKKYRERPLEFTSWLDKEDVMRAEEIIMDFIDAECSRENAQELFDEICQRVFDLDIYHESEYED